MALRYLGTGAIVPAYRGVLAIGSRETVGGGGAAVETIFQERVVWYPTQMVQVEVNQDCEFLYYVVGKKATHVGEQFAVLGFY